ncbi:MAG: hypothetical protein IPK80_14160 [Nannocystis sp.]|nr:hypothetical protein [Nannocystis sp.]
MQGLARSLVMLPLSLSMIWGAACSGGPTTSEATSEGSTSSSGSSTVGDPTSASSSAETSDGSSTGSTSEGSTSAGSTSAGSTAAETTAAGSTTEPAACAAIVGSQECALLAEVSPELELAACLLCQGIACGAEASCDDQYPCVDDKIVIQGCCTDEQCEGLSPFCGMYTGTNNVCVLHDDV